MRNGVRGTEYGERRTRNEEWRASNGERLTENEERRTGEGEQGKENRKRRTRNGGTGEQGNESQETKLQRNPPWVQKDLSTRSEQTLFELER